MHTSIVFLHVAECFYKRRKLNVQINLYLSNRLCPFRFHFLTVKGIYAELQPRQDRYFSTKRTCSVYFKYTRYFIPSVRKCQLKSSCFTKLHFFDNFHISMKASLKKLSRSLKMDIKMASGFYHVLRILRPSWQFY